MTATLDPAGLAPLLDCIARLDLTKPAAARAVLEKEFPLEGAFLCELRAAMEAGVAAGTLCQNGEAPVRWSRMFKLSETSRGFSADAVLMSAPGPKHRHPNGEVDLCFALDGAPQFDGNPPGWTVYPPDSTHVPTVTGGTMLILYLLPGAAIEFLKTSG
ncbi:MAG: DUF4863 family protein [Planctomycetota bacterium]|nr:DUF4863 family protein [Planctomycetota bacterium]